MVHEDYGSVLNELFDELTELNPTTVEIVFALNQLRVYYSALEKKESNGSVFKISNPIFLRVHGFFNKKNMTGLPERVYVIEFALSELIRGVQLKGALDAAANKEKIKKGEAQRFSCA